jgi:hypothetical protein
MFQSASDLDLCFGMTYAVEKGHEILYLEC